MLWDGRPLSDWINLLGSSDGEIRWQAIDALRHIAKPIESVPLFVVALQNDEYWRARALAAHALYDLAFDADSRPLLYPVVAHLAAALKDESSPVRMNAAHALGVIGSEAKDAVPALKEVADCGDEELRQAATEALAAIAGGNPA